MSAPATQTAPPTLQVAADEAGQTALAFLQRRIPAASASYLRQLLRQGKIVAAGEVLGEGAILAAGAILQLPRSGRVQELLAGPSLRILFESREMLIVAKPAGLAVHAGLGHETENLTAHCRELLKQRGERFAIAPVHRLDLETTGPLLFAKGKVACAALGQLFMTEGVEKTYLALVAGHISESMDLHGLIPAKGKLKEAHSALRPLAAGADATLVEVRLYSGRQHQIRRQLAACGHPLFGDRRYGGPCPHDLPRLFLHCQRLAFTDPFTGEPLAIDLSLPDDLGTFLATRGIPFPPS